jgi:hypothetical protein
VAGVLKIVLDTKYEVLREDQLSSIQYPVSSIQYPDYDGNILPPHLFHLYSKTITTYIMKIEVKENGPYLVKGKNTIVNTDGSVTENENDVYLCRCGKSANKPYCDGTHKK